MFLNSNKLSSAGIYAVNLYALGVPHTIVIDDYLPLVKDNDDNYKSKFAKPGPDKSLWGAILEKAFAKYHGNYRHTASGNSGAAIRTLSGAPYERKVNSSMSVGNLWTWLSEMVTQRTMLTASCPKGDDTKTNKDGLP